MNTRQTIKKLEKDLDRLHEKMMDELCEKHTKRLLKAFKKYDDISFKNQNIAYDKMFDSLIKNEVPDVCKIVKELVYKQQLNNIIK